MTLKDISSLLITYGILGGMGAGFLFTPGQIIHTQYFTNKLAIATGRVSHCPPLEIFLPASPHSTSTVVGSNQEIPGPKNQENFSWNVFCDISTTTVKSQE